MTRAKQRLYMTFARRRSLHGGRGYNLPSRFLGEIPDELVERQGDGIADRLGRAAAGLRRSRSGRRAAAAASRSPSPLEFRVGDDVVHATFGEGVVTAVEPGA